MSAPYIREPKYICLEQPDTKVTIDFLGTNSRKKKDRRACLVTVAVENGRLLITAKGCDDRETILCDEAYELPEEDKRR